MGAGFGFVVGLAAARAVRTVRRRVGEATGMLGISRRRVFGWRSSTAAALVLNAVAVAVAVVIAGAGCDGVSGVVGGNAPSAREAARRAEEERARQRAAALREEGEARSAGGASTLTSTGSKEFAVVLPGELDAETAWNLVLRGVMPRVARAIYVPFKSKAGEQSEAIRRAAASGAAGVIVVNYEPEGNAGALRELRESGTPHVVLGLPDPGAGEGDAGRFARLEWEPFRGEVDRMIEAIRQDLPDLGLPSDAEAIVVRETVGDALSARKFEALREGLDAAGIVYSVEDLTPGNEAEQSRIRNLIKDRPKVNIVFALGDNAFMICSLARDRLRSEDMKDSVQAGFMSYLEGLSYATNGRASYVSQLPLRVSARRATELLNELIEGGSPAAQPPLPHVSKRGDVATEMVINRERTRFGNNPRGEAGP